MSLKSLLLCGLVTLLTPSWGWGQVFLSNLDGNDVTSTSLHTSDRSKGMGFTMGSSPLTLNAVTLRLDVPDVASTSMDVALFSDSGAGEPQSRLLTFSNPVLTANGIANYSFAAPSPFALAAHTSYWIVVRDLGSFTFSRWFGSNPGATPTDPEGFPADAIHLGSTFSSLDIYPPTGNSSLLNSYALVAVPEPEGWAAVAALGLAGFVAGRKILARRPA